MLMTKNGEIYEPERTKKTEFDRKKVLLSDRFQINKYQHVKVMGFVQCASGGKGHKLQDRTHEIHW